MRARCRPSLLSLLSPLFLLSACGYAPLYAPAPGDVAASAHVQIGQVTVATQTKNVGQRRVAQTVSQRLQLDYPNHNSSLDTATVAIEENTSTLAMQRTSALQRAQINLRGRLEVTSPQGQTLLRTDLSTTSAYNVESSPYSTESGKSYARLTAARTLADEISRRLALYYRTRAINPAAVPSPTLVVTPTTLVSLTVPLPFDQRL